VLIYMFLLFLVCEGLKLKCIGLLYLLVSSVLII